MHSGTKTSELVAPISTAFKVVFRKWLARISQKGFFFNRLMSKIRINILLSTYIELEQPELAYLDRLKLEFRTDSDVTPRNCWILDMPKRLVRTSGGYRSVISLEEGLFYDLVKGDIEPSELFHSGRLAVGGEVKPLLWFGTMVDSLRLIAGEG